VREPVLVVHYAGDTITHLAEARQMHEAAVGPGTDLVVVRHADHYGFVIGPGGERGERTTAGTDAVVEWVTARV
jgi:pimeloyl-ACP methyl ester carboxylesterase